MKILNVFLFFIFFTSNALAGTIYYKSDDVVKFTSFPESIYISGEISSDLPAKLIQIIKINSIKKAIVYFNSLGGSVDAGLVLGQVIRNHNFSTGIASYEKIGGKHKQQATCYSACIFAYAGGKYRFNSKDYQLGLHRFHKASYNSTDLAFGQIVSGEIVEYFESMGVDPTIFSRMVKTRKDDIDTLTKVDAANYQLSNNGSLPTKWSYQSENKQGIMYLKGEREAWTGTGKILFTCDAKEAFATAMHVKGNIAISGKTTFTIDGKAYEIDSYMEDFNNYHSASFVLNPEQIQRIIEANSIEFNFHGSDPRVGYIFRLNLKKNKNSINSYMTRCLKILSVRHSKIKNNMTDIFAKIEKINKNLPKEVESGIVATKVVFKNSSVVYSYVITEIKDKSETQKTILNKMPAKLKQTVCNGSMKNWMETKIGIQFSYKDLIGNQIALFSFKHGDCAAL